MPKLTLQIILNDFYQTNADADQGGLFFAKKSLKFFNVNLSELCTYHILGAQKKLCTLQ
jgi:hypothetical protein